MTRVPGFLIVVLLVGARLVEMRKVDRAVVLYGLAALAVAPVLLAQWVQAGDPLAFLGAQEAWGRHLSAPWEPILFDVQRVFTLPDPGVQLLDLGSLGAALLAVTYAATHFREDRWPTQAWVWILFIVGPPLFTGTLTSMSRFTLAAWPTFIVLAALLMRLPRALRVGLCVGGVPFSVIALYWLSNGTFVA